MGRLFRSAGAFDKAQKAFDRSLSVANGDPAVIAAAADFLAEHDTPGRALVGGNMATNAGGMRAVKYGVARNFILGLEAVLPSGENNPDRRQIY